MARKKTIKEQDLAAPEFVATNIEAPQLSSNEQEVPEVTNKTMQSPQVNTENKPSPLFHPNIKPAPQFSPVVKEPPRPEHEENCIKVNGKYFEIKPTKLKYQRDRTAAFYRILNQMPLVDILALQDGILDPDRSSDKMLFDWIVAVTDDPDFVTENYNDFDSQTIERMLKIFCRLNEIDEREERKNRQAQVTNH